jgi:general nucleoside transport system ATP-binding protein
MVLPPGTNWAVTSRPPRLALEEIKRHYGRVKALDGASLSVDSGEVHALLGENGAGKSTLMKIAFGLDRPDSGTITIDGTPSRVRSPRDAMAHGIGMVQQHFALVDAMTVAENVALGSAGKLDLDSTAEQIRRISDEAGLPLEPHALVSSLPIGAQQRLEIVKALTRKTRLLILDEPTAVLSPGEASDLLAWTRRFADAGGTVILIAHKLKEVMSVADRVTVLRRGKTILTSAARDVTEAALAEAMIGDGKRMALAGGIGIRRPAEAAIAVELSHVAAVDSFGVERIRDASMAVRAGEIVGLAAIEGAGQRELLRVIAGRIQPTRGTASIPQTIGFVPEDRHREAVILDATLTENLALRGARDRAGRMPWSALRATTETLMQLRDVRARGEDAAMRTLSGGNQQKFVVGRELADAPAALVVENPTRGLDIRATEAVHAALRFARDSGTAVILYSSDLDEVLALSDRVLVVAGGTVRDVGVDRDTVGRAMLTVGG